MKENKNINFLNDIYKIVEMGVIGINDVIDKTKKSKFRELLEHQKNEYDELLRESERILTSYGAKEKELGLMVKMNSKMMSEAKLMKNSSDEEIAKMMIDGTTKGITKLEKCMNGYNEEDEEAFRLAKNLLEILKHNIEDLKIYL